MDPAAKWIWIGEDRLTVNCYLLARREFDLPEPGEATLTITACDRYRLYVNGVRVGDGPYRSEWPQIYEDTYTLPGLPLRAGRNSIAIQCHNTGLAQHGQPPGPGGLLVSLVCKPAGGGRSTKIVSDSSWRMIIDPSQQRTAPRRMFTVGFSEICDLRSVLTGWNELGFDDSAWGAADVVSDQPATPYKEVLPCPIPPLNIEATLPASVLKSGLAQDTRGITGLPFAFNVFKMCDDEVFGASFVYSARKRDVRLDFAADNRAAVFVNNRRVLCQGTSDGFFNHLHYETDFYTGLYYGHGHREYFADVTLEQGWNSLGVVIGAPCDTWGFVMRFSDRDTARTLPLRFSPHRSNYDLPAWRVISDSHLLDGCDGMLLDTPDLNPGTFPSPAQLSAWEKRRTATVAGADKLCQGKRGSLKLDPQHIVVYKMPAEIIGCIELEVRGEPGAVLDITAGEALDKHNFVRPMHNGLWLTDRIILSGQWTRWRTVDRRAMRYIELVSRNATKPVEVRELKVDAQHYQPTTRAEFESSDRTLNKLWHVGLATLDGCTQEHFEDCPIREMAQWFGDTLVEGQLAAVAWGDQALTAKALRQFAGDQPTDDWMRPMVPCGYGDKIPDYAMMYPYLLWRHWMYWGDKELVQDCFNAIVRLVNFARTFVDSAGFIRYSGRMKDIIFLDHTLCRTYKDTDIISPFQAAFVMCLDYGARVAQAINQQAKAADWSEQAEHLRQLAGGQLFDGKRGMFSEGLTGGVLEDRFTAMGNYWMLLARMGTPEQRESVLARLWPEPTVEDRSFWNRRESTYSKYYVLEALFDHGKTEQAFKLINHYYGQMMRHPDAWTIFESYHPETLGRQTPSNSLCHAYGAGPLIHYFRWICGLRPAEAGFDKLVVEPQLGSLRRLQALMPTGKGTIGFNLSSSGRKRTIEVTVPAGVEVELRRTYLKRSDEVNIVESR